MPAQYFTLLTVVRELNGSLPGAVIEDIFTQQKDELLISLSNPPGAHPEEAAGTICVSVKPSFNYFYLRTNVSRAKRNSVDLFTDIIGSMIEQIYMHPTDRTINLICSGQKTIIFELYGTAKSNIHLVGEDGTIINSFKHGKDISNTKYTGAEVRNRTLDRRQFADAVTGAGDAGVAKGLQMAVPYFGRIYRAELLARTGLTDGVVKGEADIDLLYDSYMSIMAEVSDPAPRIYTGDQKNKILSVINLIHMKNHPCVKYETASGAVKNIIIDSYHRRTAQDEKKGMLDKINRDLSGLERDLEIKQSINQTDPDFYEKIGKLLLAGSSSLKKGMKEARLLDHSRDGGEIKVALNPALTPVQNAEEYFEKAKKTRRAIIETKDRIAETEKKIKTLKRLKMQIERSENEDGIKDVKNQSGKELKELKILEDGKGKAQPPFRTFTVAGEYEVWVGKSNTNNDLLTMKYAKPNDLWFHVRGASGSHTVLKSKGRDNIIPKESIKQAAAIAAYYSKMRNAGNVPVAYCERKYVRKPKGVEAGKVMLEREEVVFVRPHLPEE